jgi:hypothetical protein
VQIRETLSRWRHRKDREEMAAIHPLLPGEYVPPVPFARPAALAAAPIVTPAAQPAPAWIPVQQQLAQPVPLEIKPAYWMEPKPSQPLLAQIRAFRPTALRKTRFSPWPSSVLNEV